MSKFPARAAAAVCAVVCVASVPVTRHGVSAAAVSAPQGAATTPIEHLIIVVGENQSFDAVFATYAPPPGERVWNLRSLGIAPIRPSIAVQESRRR
jgi:phospholipase C